MRTKICGITRIEDALAAVQAGADALGFVFAPSPRRLTPAAAAGIVRELPPFVTTVGLVVDEDPRPVLEHCPLDVLQFNGSEAPEWVAACGRRAIKAFRIRAAADLDRLAEYDCACGFLLDAFVPGIAGGTGQRFPWDLALEAKRFGKPVIVAGGLTPENVGECIRTTQPYGVDVSSGVETAPGIKDPKRLRAFLAAVREASQG